MGISQNGQPVPAPARYILHAAPETTAGNGIEARTDILQTGLTLFRLLAGLGALRAKFNSLGQANYEAALAAGKLVAASDFPPFIPNAVIRVIKKAIDPDPGQTISVGFGNATRPGKARLSWTLDCRSERRFHRVGQETPISVRVDSSGWDQCVSAGIQEKPAIGPGDAGFCVHKIEHVSRRRQGNSRSLLLGLW